MTIKSSFHYINRSKEFICSESTKINYRTQAKDFSRNRKLSFAGLAFCLIKLLRQNIQIELETYFSSSNNLLGTTYSSMSTSAFVQSRKKMKPEMFYDLTHCISNEFYEDNDENVCLYKGRRLLAIDGSTINLPVNASTKAVYGTISNQNKIEDVVIGRVSVLYDLLNEIVLDGKLGSYSVGEVSMSRDHHCHLKKNDIVIMDRAYPNFQSMYYMQENFVDFIYRCKTSFSNEVQAFFDSKKKEALIEIKPSQSKSLKDFPYHKETAIKVRMLRIDLPSGEAEILMTSLRDNKAYPKKDFKQLYYKRWGVETFYNRFKNIIGVENFSGTSEQFIQQEFNCALYMSNMQSILTKEAQREANEKYENRLYEYRVNSSLSLCFIRRKLLDLLMNEESDEKSMIELKKLFVLNVVPIRPNRAFERNTDKYRVRKRPKQFQNRRTVL